MIKYSVLFLAIAFVPSCAPQAVNDFIQGEERTIQQVIKDETGVPPPTAAVPYTYSPPIAKIVLFEF